MELDIILYSRTFSCPYTLMAKKVLNQNRVPYKEILIDRDPVARRWMVDWTGYEAVPTIVAAAAGTVFPLDAPTPLAKGASPRGVNRGSMITEPTEQEFIHWLRRNQFIR